jgi:hypothetical protein
MVTLTRYPLTDHQIDLTTVALTRSSVTGNAEAVFIRIIAALPPILTGDV